MKSEAPPRTPVFGLPFSDTHLDAAARHLVRSAVEGRERCVVFVNAHCLNESVHDPELERAIQSADVIYADGVGMAIAARMHGQRLRHNVNGTDLFPFICHYADAARLPIALLGGAPGVTQACVDEIEARYPGVQVVWHHHGFIDAADDRHVVAELNRAGARMLLVARGVPLQERWIMENRHALTVPVILGVGGLFDFVSGSTPRAPRGLRRLRLEWLFRLALEPRRLFIRYVLGNPLFLLRAIRYSVTGNLRSQVAARRMTSQ